MRSATTTRSPNARPSKVVPFDRSHGTRALRLSPFSRPMCHMRDMCHMSRGVDVPLHSRCLSELPLVLTVVLLFMLATFL